MSAICDGSCDGRGFSPTTGGGELSDLVAHALTISSGSSQSSSAGTVLFRLGITNLLLVAGMDLIAPECGAGVFKGNARAFGLFALAVVTLGVQICTGLGCVELRDVQLPADCCQGQGQDSAGDDGRIGFELVEPQASTSGRSTVCPARAWLLSVRN